mgnify:CR=1 FL=1
MAITIKDIAEYVGVSPSTVSRALNGNNVISEATGERIREAMRELDYHPNSRARNFARRSTNTIALIINAENEGAFFNTFFNRSVYAIEKVMQNHKYDVLITNDSDNTGSNTGSSVSELVYEQKVDGLILPCASVRKELLEILEKENFPYVVLGEPLIHSENLVWVDVENETGSRQAVRHLAEQGYQKIVLVVENENTIFAKKRIKGYCRGVSEEEKDRQDPVVLLSSGDSVLFEKKVLETVEEAHADAFLCSNNMIAYQVMSILKRENIPIPEQVGIVTFDNYPFAEYMDPPLSVVDVDTYKLGKVASDLLLERISNVEPDRRIVFIDTNLICRDSSKRRKG